MDTGAEMIVVDFLDVQSDKGKSNNIILLNFGKWKHLAWGDTWLISLSTEWWWHPKNTWPP